MPIWSDILKELAEATPQGEPLAFDVVRRRYLAQLHKHSERNVILYASAWLQTYMFREENDSSQRAESIAERLADHRGVREP